MTYRISFLPFRRLGSDAGWTCTQVVIASARTTSRARGQFTAKVTAPPGTRVAWFSAGGSFTAHQGDAAPRTKNAMARSAQESGGFREFYRADVPAGQSHWHYNADVEVKLDTPLKTVFIRYTGDPGVNNLRIFAHCVEDTPSSRSPVRITHAWRERGELKTRTVTLQKPGPYEVTAESDPVDEYVELSVPRGVR